MGTAQSKSGPGGYQTHIKQAHVRFDRRSYYSIESWLLQNMAVAKSLCRKHRRGRDLDKFEAWERDRTQLDEVDKPKKATCLGAGHNLELASTAFPARTVYEGGTSFTESANRLRACVPLATALAATHPDY